MTENQFTKIIIRLEELGAKLKEAEEELKEILVEMAEHI